MNQRSPGFLVGLACAAAGSAAAAPVIGKPRKQPTNWRAISRFAAFVVFTLFITKWAVAFATILAAVAGLTLSGASAVSHESTPPWSSRAGRAARRS